MIKAVLFDLDGTLIDSREYIYQAFEHTLVTHGYPPVARNRVRRYIGRSLADTYGSLVGMMETEDLRKTHGQFQLKNFHLVKSFRYTANALKSIHQSGVTLAIVTSRNQYIYETLKVAKIPIQYFKTVVGGLEVNNHKPHPEPIELALRKLSLGPEQAIFVGDGVADILAAKAAKVISVGVTYGFGYKTHLKQAGANYLIPSLRELPHLIETVNDKNS